MTESGATGAYVVECFWPGVNAEALRSLAARAAASAGELTRGGTPVSYLGSLLMCDDEVVLCLFEGAEPAVRQVAERAEVPFEPILDADRSPWPIAHNA